MDDDGHGTHVAGIVAAVQDNLIGGSGISPRIKLMILRVGVGSGGWPAEARQVVQTALRDQLPQWACRGKAHQPRH